ncbi:MAG TPA: polysaccharide deacetylase family protein [Myxococcales bacterium]|nr:polysaccharide deacetylase family protein [Myxococcales bacterium]
MPRWGKGPLLCAVMCAAACGRGVPILMYHSVGADSDPLTVAPEEFDAQLDFLQSAGFNTVSLADLIDAQNGAALPRNPVVLTFDDGYLDAYTTVLPRLLQRGQVATFFIVSGFCARDEATRVTKWQKQFLLWPEVSALRDAGMEIGSHTVWHVRLSQLSSDDLHAEVNDSRNVLQAYLGTRVDFFAYPYNDQARWVRRAVEKAGYRGAVIGARGNSDAFTLQRLTMHRGITPQDLRSMLSESWETTYTEGG